MVLKLRADRAGVAIFAFVCLGGRGIMERLHFILLQNSTAAINRVELLTVSIKIRS